MCSCSSFVAVFPLVLELLMLIEERPPIRRVAENKLNKQSWTADEGWSSSLGVGRGANNPPPRPVKTNVQKLSQAG